MDPLTHTFVGAALSESGLKRRTRFAATALLVGANLPDVDGLSYFLGSDFALGFRRGWTHGILLVALQPFLLSGLLVVMDRFRPGPGSPARFKTLLWLSTIAVVSHPVLDWLNTYGVRFLMPFDGRWFYGDGLFVIDPYVWLMLGGAIFLARPIATIGERVIWGVLMILTSIIVLGSPFTPSFGRWVWLSGLLVITALAFLGPNRKPGRTAMAGLAMTAAYIVSMLAGSSIVASEFASRLPDGKGDAADIMASPLPGNPFSRDLVAKTSDGYRSGNWNLFRRPSLSVYPTVIPLLSEDPLVQSALEAPHVRGAVIWMRYPYVELEPTPQGTRVWLIDARYNRLGRGGFGSTVIDVDPAGRPLGPARSP